MNSTRFYTPEGQTPTYNDANYSNIVQNKKLENSA